MIIGGLQKFSLLDYPGHLSAIIFTQSCNFRCGFCYNPMLVLPQNRNTPPHSKSGAGKDRSQINEDGLFDFLKNRAGKLDGVVITGGEPTIHKDLPEFIKKIKQLDFKVKLDTNGTNPEMLEKLINVPLIRGIKEVKEDNKSNNPPHPTCQGGMIDYIAMDIKAPIDKYKKITKFNGNLADIKKSVKIIMNSKLPYEFRTTIIPGLIEKEDIFKMGKMINGARIWYLQQFKSDTDLVDKKFQKIKPYSDKELKEMCNLAKKYVKRCVVR